MGIIESLRNVKKYLSMLPLVDKWLLVFMLILISQSGFNLFVGGTTGGSIDTVDIVVRTSSAAIFGYFLSSNFAHHIDNGKTDDDDVIEVYKTPNPQGFPDPSQPTGGLTRAKIGFSSSPETSNLTVGQFTEIKMTAKERKKEEEHASSSAQITVASILGIFCLIMLLAWRNWTSYYPDHATMANSAAIISQFRDFVSGSVGFLIGCPNVKTGNKK